MLDLSGPPKFLHASNEIIAFFDKYQKEDITLKCIHCLYMVISILYSCTYYKTVSKHISIGIMC